MYPTNGKLQFTPEGVLLQKPYTGGSAAVMSPHSASKLHPQNEGEVRSATAPFTSCGLQLGARGAGTEPEKSSGTGQDAAAQTRLLRTPVEPLGLFSKNPK